MHREGPAGTGNMRQRGPVGLGPTFDIWTRPTCVPHAQVSQYLCTHRWPISQKGSAAFAQKRLYNITRWGGVEEQKDGELS